MSVHEHRILVSKERAQLLLSSFHATELDEENCWIRIRHDKCLNIWER
jgi:hypothetical protein